MRASIIGPFAPFAAWLALGTASCFGGSSNVDAPNTLLPDADVYAQSPDATSGEVAIDAQASTDAETGPDASIDSASGGDASVDGEAEAAPPFDAGAGCIPPGPESALSPTTEGLPSDGLLLWLRGDHGVYMTGANRVCAWADQSGNGTILSNPGPTGPLLIGPGGTLDAGAAAGPDGGIGAGIGGQPGIFFDAPGSELLVGGVLGIPATSGRTFIVVARMVATAGRFESIAQGTGGSAGTYVMIDANTWQSAGNREGVYFTNNSYDTALATSTDPRVHVFTIATLAGGDVSGNMDYRVNGATQSFTLRAGTGSIESFSTANYTQVGGVDPTNTVGSAGTGVIAEALVYSRALDVTERASVESALMARYGIP